MNAVGVRAEVDNVADLRRFRVQRDRIGFRGEGLSRPECVLMDDGDALWVSDSRAAIVRIGSDGQTFIPQRIAGEAVETFAQSCPNGLGWDGAGALLVANIGRRRLERMTRDGMTEAVLERFEGRDLGLVNFVIRDSLDRIWISISTQRPNLFDAFRPDCPDGRILLLQPSKPPRIFADGLHFPNEMRLHPSGEWLYVAETTAKRIRRIRVEGDGEAGRSEIVGPDSLGTGFPDGIAFDELGNLWIAMLGADRIDVLFPDGSVSAVLEDGKADRLEEVDDRFRAGTLTFGDLVSAAGSLAPLFTSVAFGGPSRRTVYIGSLKGTRLPCFEVPVAGLRP